MKILLGILNIIIIFSAFAQENRIYQHDSKLVPREHNVDMHHLALMVSFEPKIGKVNGIVELTFSPLRSSIDTLFLDAPGIKIIKVTMEQKEINFTQSKKGITLNFDNGLAWDNQYKVEITYSAFPRKGLYFVGWNDAANNSRKQIWTQGQGIDNRYWIPHYDNMNDKLTTEIFIDFDNKYQVLSNGDFVAKKKVDATTDRWHYKMKKPHTSYLMMLGIGKYAIKEDSSATGIPMYSWYYPEFENRVEWSYKLSVEMMDFFEEEIGVPYPWKTYSQIPVQDFMYGAMENTTATLFGDFYMVDEYSFEDRSYVSTNAHELAHQWFGDYVTARSNAHVWLQESFATYYSAIFEREVYGDDFYNWWKREAMNSALNASKKDLNPIAHSEGGVARLYPKGAVVLDMLSALVGRDEYNRAIKYYLLKHPYGVVDSEDLLIAFHESLGYSLDWFWNQWIYRGGEPSYNVSYISYPDSTIFSVSQAHSMSELVGLFKMPIIFEVQYTDGTFINKKVWIEDEHTRVVIPNQDNREISYLLFDPNNTVLKTVFFEKSLKMLSNQFLNSPYMIDRYDALVQMRNYPVKQKIKVLREGYENNNFHAIKSEIIEQLKSDDSKITINLMKVAINDKHVKVRKSTLNSILVEEKFMLPYYETLLDDSYYTVEKALKILCKEHPEKATYFIEKSSHLKGTRGLNVEITRLEMASMYTDKSKDSLLIQLINYTSESYEFLTRLNALNVLKKLDYFSEDLMLNLFNALLSTNRRLSTPAKSALLYYLESDLEREKQIRNFVNYNQWRKWQQKVVDNVITKEK